MRVQAPESRAHRSRSRGINLSPYTDGAAAAGRCCERSDRQFRIGRLGRSVISEAQYSPLITKNEPRSFRPASTSVART